jgi:hypothetical protein
VELTVKLTRKRALVAVAALALIAAAIAVAAWIVTGSGNGTAKAGSLQPLTVTQASSTTGAVSCFPGGSCDIVVNVTNPNEDLVITKVEPGGTGISLTGGGFCPPSSFTRNTVNGLNIPLPAGSTPNIKLPGALSLDSAAPTTCQGVTVTAPVVLTASTP